MVKIRSYLHSVNNPMKVTRYDLEGNAFDCTSDQSKAAVSRVSASLEIWRETDGRLTFCMANARGDYNEMLDMIDLLQAAKADIEAGACAPESQAG